MQEDRSLTRRGFFGRALAGAALTAGTVVLGRGAAAQSKAPKKAVQYQKEPNVVNGKEQRCDNCRFWIPVEETDHDLGGCQVVGGKIEPAAWCNLWSGQS